MDVSLPAPLIVTFALEAGAQAHFNALRKKHFPPERNFLEAHITLFHHLPGMEQPAIQETLNMVATAHTAFALHVREPWMMGRGVSFRLESAEAKAVRASLAASWKDWLTPQDAQGWRPHITVQNKVSSAEAKALHATLSQDFKPFSMTATGLTLWRYLGGPWEKIADMAFQRL
jgi:hypothetical protein